MIDEKKLIERLEEAKEHYGTLVVVGKDDLVLNYNLGKMHSFEDAISIVNELAKEYKDKYVSLETLKQVMWERDLAISQLKELGYEFGEKVGWIPCSERLPEVGQMCLCSVNYEKYTDVLHDIILCKYEEKYINRWADWYTAWQPLPEPYKPKEQPDSISEAWKQQTMSRFERVE